MDFRKIKSGMRVKAKEGKIWKHGTIKYVYNDYGYKMFDILFDGEEVLSNQWSLRDRKRLNFYEEMYKEDFAKLLKKVKKQC